MWWLARHYNSEALTQALRPRGGSAPGSGMKLSVVPAVIVCVATSATLVAQQAPPKAPAVNINSEAAGLMQGWALMAQGQHGLAESHAATILQKFPRSLGAVVLAIEAGIAASGGEAGLDQYDRWMAARRMEE